VIRTYYCWTACIKYATSTVRLMPDNHPDTSSDTSEIVTLWGSVYTAAALCRNESFAGDGDENKALEE